MALHGAEVVVADDAVVLRLDDRLLERLRRDAADVEGTHGELRAGLADGLRGDDADRFAELDHLAGRQVAAVALARSSRAWLSQVSTERILSCSTPIFSSALAVGFVDEVVRLDERRLPVTGSLTVFAGDAADDAGREIDDFFVTLVDRRDDDAVGGAAIVLGDDDVLRRIDELAGQVAGVGGLERGVGQTLAGAVRGDEVLEHRQTFAEVRGDRALDDFAVGLGHEAAHAGELLDLLAVAARAGVDHEVNRVAASLRPSLCSRVRNMTLAISSPAWVQMSMILL